MSEVMTDDAEIEVVPIIVGTNSLTSGHTSLGSFFKPYIYGQSRESLRPALAGLFD